jgi:HEAT repeat protein
VLCGAVTAVPLTTAGSPAAIAALCCVLAGGGGRGDRDALVRLSAARALGVAAAAGDEAAFAAAAAAVEGDPSFAVREAAAAVLGKLTHR